LRIEKYAAVAAPPADDVPNLSFERIYAQRFHDVSRWVRALGGLDADLDDITQEVFVVVQRKLPSFDGNNVSAWLYSIARKVASDYRRSAWIKRLFGGLTRSTDSADAPVLIHHGLDPSEALERREIQKFVARLLNQMSTAQRTAFVLFEIEAYSGEEIAALEGIPLNTVWTRLHHARKKFLDLIDHARAEGTLP
jgi:RNA polymerase sigma-70 factor (ECF subfamily)